MKSSWQENTPIFNEFQKVIDALDALSKPVVAAVSGPAVSQGAAMLYHCDLVFAGEHALFSMPGLALGQTPRYGVSLLAVKSGGYKLAAQKLLLSEPISAAEAVAMGLVNHIVEDDQSHDRRRRRRAASGFLTARSYGCHKETA